MDCIIEKNDSLEMSAGYKFAGYVHHRATILDLRTTTSAEFISITVLAAM